MSERRVAKLGEIATLNRASVTRDWPYERLRYIDISSVGTGRITAPPQDIARTDAPGRARRLVAEGDTVLSTVRPIRRSLFFAAHPAENWVVSTGFCVISPDTTQVDPRFLYLSVFSPDFTAYLVSRERGAAYPAVSPEDIAEAPIMLPPMSEQRAISAALGALDDKIESNVRTVELSLDLLDALAVARQDTPRVALGNLATAATESVNPTALQDEVVDHFSLPAFDAGATPEAVRASTIMSSKQLLDSVSVLVSRLNPRTNRTWWAVPRAGVRALASSEFAALRTSSQELPALWLAVRDPMFRDELTRRTTGTSGSHQRVRLDDVLNIDVPDTRRLPSEEASRARSLLDLVHVRRSENVSLAALRDALLPDLLSGRRQAGPKVGV